jgi:hypothetical protein
VGSRPEDLFFANRPRNWFGQEAEPIRHVHVALDQPGDRPLALQIDPLGAGREVTKSLVCNARKRQNEGERVAKSHASAIGWSHGQEIIAYIAGSNTGRIPRCLTFMC